MRALQTPVPVNLMRVPDTCNLMDIIPSRLTANSGPEGPGQRAGVYQSRIHLEDFLEILQLV